MDQLEVEGVRHRIILRLLRSRLPYQPESMSPSSRALHWPYPRHSQLRLSRTGMGRRVIHSRIGCRTVGTGTGRVGTRVEMVKRAVEAEAEDEDEGEVEEVEMADHHHQAGVGLCCSSVLVHLDLHLSMVRSCVLHHHHLVRPLSLHHPHLSIIIAVAAAAVVHLEDLGITHMAIIPNHPTQPITTLTRIICISTIITALSAARATHSAVLPHPNFNPASYNGQPHLQDQVLPHSSQIQARDTSITRDLPRHSNRILTVCLSALPAHRTIIWIMATLAHGRDLTTGILLARRKSSYSSGQRGNEGGTTRYCVFYT